MTTPTPPRHEILVGLHVTDDDAYTKYRTGMTPILQSHGGYFRYDYRVNEMLKGNAEHPHNRIFILSFPDEPTMTRFFENTEYKAIRKKYFDPAVRSGGILSSFKHTPG